LKVCENDGPAPTMNSTVGERQNGFLNRTRVW
jgi:hypothetical protein